MWFTLFTSTSQSIYAFSGGFQKESTVLLHKDKTSQETKHTFPEHQNEKRNITIAILK